VWLLCDLQVLDRLKAASAYVQLAQSLTKLTKAAEGKLARAAAKLYKVPTLQTLQAQLQTAVEAAQQHCSTVKVRCGEVDDTSSTSFLTQAGTILCFCSCSVAVASMW
jgi:hypothetical protein